MKLKLTRTFIQTTTFFKRWNEAGFCDEDMLRLEEIILENPKIGPVIPGTGRMRKMRFAFKGRSKSRSVRVCYVDFELKETVILLMVFSKNEQVNLTKIECNQLKKLIDILESEL